MENHEIIKHIVHGMEYYMETLALPEHMEKHDDGMCAWINPKPGTIGPEAVYRVNFQDKTEHQIRQIIQMYRENDMPEYWCITPLSAPEGIRDLLISLEIIDPNEERSLGMALLPDDYSKPAEETISFSIRKVTTKEDFKIFADIANEVLHGFKLLDPELYYPLCASGKMVCFLGYSGEIPVATSATMNNNGSSTVEFVATLPDFRKKGIGTAVCRAAIEQLIGDGASIVTLRARALGVSIYKGLGFKAFY